MNFVYLYDGSFDGFLTCVYESYYGDKKPIKITLKTSFIPNLIETVIDVETCIEKASKVFNAIETKIGRAALKNIFTVYLSEAENFEMLLLNYIRLGFRLGFEIHNHLHNDIVLQVVKLCRKVNNEAHLMCGFVRFKELQNSIYYSVIEPDHNILTLIAPHFSERLANEKWIIHDVKRESAVLYDTKEWILTPFSKDAAKEFFSERDEFEVLWRTYYKTVVIKERTNPRLQKRMMPARYWKYIIETL
ncbi:TIGR03915 family putative DNA repair protein [Clostridium sp. 19966]|uniref:TIGR03915 family putative DNA repair protein n=1 Tax=Clostridium sp. 19966 TaxID=2768166 RepID=UPI0028E01976|nr:TIGR03915 family putative DNA repair protein [Clostridium sp. 19966]MDT8715633.1 TIGR03915 family putative DNA repair protein [Clostridium sp. 19966]